ncbi:MAG: tRNA uridine-5-carboxymethylaminomethyl(34) synthesis GTPase MnmE [Williamsia sp.]|nr:tRNA uridine-5-carboxymethylaminomethyl(34) synthesis GTPase MnmE [Williamsia sp.]
MNKLSGWEDTIVALATAPGISAIGVIRLSGKEAVAITNSLFSSKNLLEQESHTLHVGLLKEEGKTLDEVVVSIYKAPKSYTGENIVEISCHGSPYVQQQIIDACIRKGARLAKPGEFTQRAFLHGKLDLTQAEAVADLIASNTQSSHKSALHAIKGGFSRVLRELREQLLSFSALIELELDFSQEDVAFADRTQLYSLVNRAAHTVSDLLHSFQLGNVVKQGVQVAIIGKPNAGKSTLLNTLLQDNRAIVSEIAGTTRDTVEEVLNIDGILFRLIDTAGIREHTTDLVESLGIEKSREKMSQADIVVYLFDAYETTPEELQNQIAPLRQEGKKVLLVANKWDDQQDLQVRKTFDHIEGLIFISAKQNLHTEILKERLLDMVLQGTVQTESTIITNARHFHALQQVHNSLQDIINGLDQQIPSDLVALDIRRCLQYIGEITGEITTEDQLDYIFSKFCIGK